MQLNKKVVLEDLTVMDVLDRFEQCDFSIPEVRHQYQFFRKFFMTPHQISTHSLILQGFDKLSEEWDKKQDIFKNLRKNKHGENN